MSGFLSTPLQIYIHSQVFDRFSEFLFWGYSQRIFQDFCDGRMIKTRRKERTKKFYKGSMTAKVAWVNMEATGNFRESEDDGREVQPENRREDCDVCREVGRKSTHEAERWGQGPLQFPHVNSNSLQMRHPFLFCSQWVNCYVYCFTLPHNFSNSGICTLLSLRSHTPFTTNNPHPAKDGVLQGCTFKLFYMLKIL